MAALVLLLRRRAKKPLPTDLAAAATVLRTRLANAYLLGRLSAHRAGWDSALRELELFESGVVLHKPPLNLFHDPALAQRAARGYSDRWLRDAALARHQELAEPAAIASRKQAWRLDLGASTEAATAFNEGRESAYRALSTEYPDIASQYVRVWDSALEKRTCDVCAGAHGSWVYLGEQFPEGTPGHVHPNCHCEDHIEPLVWQDLSREAA